MDRYSFPSYFYPPFQDSARAIQDMGTNALPSLLDWATFVTPTWKAKLYPAVNAMLSHVNSSWYLTDEKHVRRVNGAIEALIHLGSMAEGGVRNLSEKANGPAPVESRLQALSILCRLGRTAQPALPAVVKLLSDGDPHVGFVASKFVHNLLTAPDRMTRDAATNALRAIDPEALERGRR